MERTFTRFEVGERTYPELLTPLKEQLDHIVPSENGSLGYYPCCVTLKNGQAVDRVFIVAAQPYIEQWGIWPDQDSHKHEVQLEDVAEIQESTSRLPARFANELYLAGESGMGYTVFTVRFRDGTEKAYASGNAIDFISFPIGQTSADIIEVLPHVGRDRAVASNTPYFWCIYGTGTPRGTVQRWQQ